jgi:hypothetical protein
LGERFVQEIRGTENGQSPVLSPDGKEVLFAVRRPGGGYVVKRIDVRGGVARTLMDSSMGNGQLSWRNESQILTTGPDRGLALLNTATGTSSILARPDSGYALGFPNVLPGGHAALITIRRLGATIDSSMLGVVTIPAGKVTSLGVHGLSPHYSPTGHIVFVTAKQLVEAVPFDAGHLRITGSPTVLATDVAGGSGGAVPLAIADDGTLAFIQGAAASAANVRPVIVNRTGAKRFLGIASDAYGTPRVSPDGKQFAYVAGRALNGNEFVASDIWRVDISTGQASRVTTGEVSDYPAWSRDGTEIYFARGAAGTEYAVALTANAQPHIIFRAPGRLRGADFGPPHGHAVFAVYGPTSTDLWTAPLDSLDQPAVFAAGPYQEEVPRLSPDGRFVAYESNRTGVIEIYLKSIAGAGEEVKVSTGGGIDPVWSRDGRELYFIAGELPGEVSSAAAQLMVAQVTTSPRIAVASLRQLFPMREYLSMASRSSYDVFPNGDFLMLGLQTDSNAVRSTPLVVRTNWTSSLVERQRDRTP